MPMEVKYQKIDIKTLNISLDPWHVLKEIGYEKSDPKEVDKELRDYCPIHGGDHQRSLSIDINKKQFKCHNCNARGDLVTLYCLANVLDVRDPKTYQDIAKTFNYTEEPTTGTTDTTVIIAKESREPFDPPPNVEKIWGRYSEDGDHPYIKEKKITRPDGIKFGNDAMGNHSIIVPYRNVEGVLQSLQYITTTGKYFLKGAPTGGSFFTIGSIETAQKLYLCEGLATGVTIYKSLREPAPVVSVGSKSNLPKVFTTLRSKCPQLKIIIALDKGTEDIINKLSDSVTYCVPNFDGMNWDGEKEPTDFNDLISKCGKTIEVVKEQLQTTASNFFNELGNIIQDESFALKLQKRSYVLFEEEHKRLFSSGGLITGFSKLDKDVFFSKGDFVTLQGMSNHGKSTLMLQLAYRFVSNQENEKASPMCIFITYESTPLRIEEKLLNIIGHEKNEGTVLQYCRQNDEKYLYPNGKDFFSTILTYNELLKNDRIHILKRVQLEKLDDLVDLYKRAFPERTIVLFLDYLQIIDSAQSTEGWERIKSTSYKLEDMAIKKEIILLSGCQVNEKRQAREGRDIYNASTINVDIFDHSHASVVSNPDLEKKAKDQINGKNVCSIEVRKQKHGASFILPEYLLFNGHMFEENSEADNRREQAEDNISGKSLKAHHDLF